VAGSKKNSQLMRARLLAQVLRSLLRVGVMAKKAATSASYHVLVQGIKLDPEAEKRIEVEIRRVVMQELASIDFKGDLQISPISKFPDLFDPRNPQFGGGHIAGIWAVDPSAM
jgi:hypothetical protein